MANYNKVILVGNLTRDPQMSYLPSQTAVVEFGLAVNRRWRSQDGQMKEETCFVDCRSYGKQAETLNQYMAKGRPILVEGRLQYDTWEGKDGTKRSKHRIVVERFQFLGSQGGRGAAQSQSAPASRPAPPSPDSDEYTSPPSGEADGENIPF